MNYLNKYTELYNKRQEKEEEKQTITDDVTKLQEELDFLYPKVIQEGLPKLFGKLISINDSDDHIHNYIYISEGQEVYHLEYGEVVYIGNCSEIDFSSPLEDLRYNKVFDTISCLSQKDFNRLFKINLEWYEKEVTIESLLTNVHNNYREFGKLILNGDEKELKIFCSVCFPTAGGLRTCCGANLLYLNPRNKIETISELLSLLRDYPSKICKDCKAEMKHILNTEYE